VACVLVTTSGSGLGLGWAQGLCTTTTRGDLVGERVSAAKLACIARDIRDHQEQLARLVLSLDWSSNKARTRSSLARIPADGADWYGLAEIVAPQDPRVGFELYALAAQRSPGTDVGLAANAKLLRLAKARAGRLPNPTGSLPYRSAGPGSAEQASKLMDDDVFVAGQRDRARAQLIADAKAGQLRKLQVLRIAVEQDEPRMIEEVCDHATEPAAIWPCAENDPAGLKRHLKGLSSLPMLSFKDIGRLRQIPKSQSVLPELACADGRWQFDPGNFIAEANRSRAVDPEVAIIYYRLRDGAPAGARQCLLEKAAIACLQLVTAGKSCPVLSAFADYMRGLGPGQQEAVLSGVFRTKATFYQLRLLSSRTKEAEDVLFHLHLLLAEVLLGRPGPTEASRLSQYHVHRALQLWKRAPDPGVQFSDLLSDQVLNSVCRDPQACLKSCTAGFSGCVRTCTELSTAAAAMCPRP